VWRRRTPAPTGSAEETSTMPATDPVSRPPKQLLHLVFGGELESLADIEFANLDRLDMVGMFPNYAEAYKAWKAAAQQTVDNAHMRYFIVHIHRLLDPSATCRRDRKRFGARRVQSIRGSHDGFSASDLIVSGGGRDQTIGVLLERIAHPQHVAAQAAGLDRPR
jgi:Domain of unknown function (DUF4170)